jgi:hypothetical protein
MEFDLGRKAYGMTGNKINDFNQVVRPAGRANTNHSKCLFGKESSREIGRKTYRERKNPTATHITAIQSQDHFRFPNVLSRLLLAAARSIKRTPTGSPERRNIRRWQNCSHPIDIAHENAVRSSWYNYVLIEPASPDDARW